MSDQAAIIAWLASPAGVAWSRQTFRAAEHFSLGVFGGVLPQPWGKPWRCQP